MCVAIGKLPGVVIEKSVLEACFKANSDGCGFAYINHENEIQIFKSMEFDEFYDAYKIAEEEFVDSPFLIHFRIKTHGTKDIFNCHPFRINDDMVFIHNGVISKVKDCPDKKKSDTQMFNEEVLQKLPEGWYDSPGVDELILEYIGYSKLVVLNRLTKDIKIYNESKGTWKDKVWFSNTLWENRRYDNDTVVRRCLQCYNNITHNVYANTQKVPYCSTNCKTIHEKTVQNKCAWCAQKNVYIWSTHKHGRHGYCCTWCETQHIAYLDKQKESNAQRKAASSDITLVECDWCNEMRPESAMIEFESYSITGYKDKLCVSCVKEAIEAGFVVETPALRASIDTCEKALQEQVYLPAVI